MFDRKDLEALAAYQGEHPVLSLYLHLDPRLRGTPDAYRARLKGLLKTVGERAPAEDVTAVEDYFEKEFDWLGRGVALFSSQNSGLWRVDQFEVPVRSYVYLGQKPFITPLVDLLDTYGSYSVALVERQTCRMLHVHLGELVAEEKVEGEEVKRLKGGGGAGGAARRGGDDLSGYGLEVVRGNLKTFAEALDAFCARHRVEHLLLGGSEATVSQFKGMLNQPCQNRLTGTFSIAREAGDTEILERSLEVIQANQKAYQDDLVDRIKALDAMQSTGVTGAEGTLGAIHAGRVQTLALVEGYQAPGYRCRSCGYATTGRAETCPFCQEPLEAKDNIAEHAIRQVIEQGGEVEFLDSDSALVALGGMGALLRY
jgi:peptide subunit release factor 1 (eRF1)